MALSRSIRVAFALVCGSLLVTTAVWMWMLSRPHGTFNDQGGMLISFILFPATMLGWALLAVPSGVIAIWLIWRGGAQDRFIASLILLMVVFAILYAVAIFFCPLP